jgi:predicted amidophosphoribosyltransferase
MPTLIQCHFCNSQMSSEAAVCPKCRKSQPRKRSCAVCQQTALDVDMMRVSRMLYPGREPEDYFHRACLEQVQETSYNCPACGVSINKVGRLCPNCNHPLKVDKCFYCRESLFVATAHVKRKIHHGSQYPVEIQLSHDACAQSRGSGSPTRGCGIPTLSLITCVAFTLLYNLLAYFTL